MREIDRLIATEVMGWEIKKVNYSPDGSYYEAYFKNGEMINYVDAVEFFPSTNIADAWLVVEKLRETGYEVELFIGEVNAVRLFDYETEDLLEEMIGEKGEEIEELICRVALKRKGVSLDG